MFSRIKSTSHREIRSVFKSIFGDNQPKSSPPSSPQKRKIKSSFSRRLKNRLSSIRLPGRNGAESSSEKDGIYNTIESPRYDFAISSILKTKPAKGKRKRSIRFVGSSDRLSTLEELGTTMSVDPVPERVPDQSDIDYYTKMKEELLNRSKELEMKKPLKRKASAVESPSKMKKRNHYECEPFDMKLKKWPHNDESLFVEDSTPESENSIYYANCPYEDRKFSGKLVTLKMIKEQRFNPSNRESYCRLSAMSDFGSKMSTCSV